MSTPTGKPFRFTDTRVSQRAAGPASPEKQGPGNQEDSLHLIYAPKWARSPGMAFDATASARPLVDPDSARPVHSSDPRSSATAHQGHIMSRFERLEGSLPSVPPGEAAMRLPRAAQLLPVPGLGSGDSSRLPLSLESQRRVPPDPMILRRRGRRWPLIVPIAGVLLSAISYYFFHIGRWAPPATNRLQAASVNPIAVSPLMPQQQEPVKDSRVSDLATTDAASQIINTPQNARSPEVETLAVSQHDKTSIHEAASTKAVRILHADEIKFLMKQAEQLAEVGDFVTARLVFQRAAEAGEATAATALGATYDPTLLAKLGVLGIGADLEKARYWYQKAVSLGSSDAKRRLELLASR